MYNKDILIDEIKNNKLPITKSEIEELSLSDSYVGKSDKDILQALVDLDLLLKKFFFRMMKKSKEKGLDFFKLCHKKMKKAYEVWSMACSNEYERNKLGTIYENSMFMHKEFYRQKTFASKEPLITVLMPTFNSENYIGETLWSVFEQTCPDFELLIMNEAGSSPETTEVISFFEDDRIKVVQNKTRLGLAESLNEGIKIARGKYIARIDADDLATEDRFELQANFLENNKEYGLCGSRQHHFGVDTDFVHEVAEEHDDIKAALIYGCEICHSTIMIRREYFLKNNLFYDNTKKAEDYELWTRAVHKFKFHNIKKVLGEYRVGAENITKNKFNALSAESAVIAANNLSKYLNVNVSKAHLEYLTGWENRFEEVEEKERKVALEEEEAILREMVKNNLIYKNYKDSSLLIAINRRWRWILGKYSYGHDLDEILNVDDLFKKYPFSEVRCDEENCTDKSFSFKQCLKGVLKFFYTPFRHGISYKMRQQLWDLDGHLKDSKDEILNNVTDSKYDILNHVKDSETRLKQQTYLMLEKNGNELYDQLERSIEKLEGQVESIKAMVELQNASLKEMIDSRIYKAETNLGQTFDSRIYKAETNLGQTFDSRIYKAEENLSQTVDGRVWKSELYLKKEILGKIWILNRMLTDLVNLQKDKSEYGSTSIYGSNFYEDNQYGSYLSAIEVLKYVIPIYKPESIVDFGCGTGTWLAATRQINRDIQIIGVDGDYVDTDMLMIDKEYFLPRDLSKELDLHRKFDIAMSLEVAEHLEEKYADIFVDTLCRHSDIILFSAAHVGQGGDGHVNEQPISYWVEKFQKRGYTWHDIRDVFKANYDIEQWYKDNISIFIKER